MSLRTDRAKSPPSRSRIALLVVGLGLVAAAWLVVNIDTIRTQLLNRQSLAALESDAIRPDADALTRRTYARRLVALGRAGDAVPFLQTLVREIPTGAQDRDSQSRLAELAHALALSDRIDEARPVLEQARKIEPNDPLLILTGAWIDRAEGRFDLAIGEAKLFLELRPNEPEAWRLLGAIGNASRKAETALEPLQKALALDPDCPATHAEMGHALAYQGKYDRAIAEFRTAVRLDPATPSYRAALSEALALAARTPTEYREARTLLAERLAAEPENVELLFTLAQIELRSNAFDSAREHLNAKVAQDPLDGDTWYLLAQTERRLGNQAAADAALARFRRLSPIQDRVAVAVTRVARRPADASRRLVLARAFAAANNPTGAYWQHKIALQLDPKASPSPAEASAFAAAYAGFKKQGGQPDDPRLVGPPAPSSGAALGNLMGALPGMQGATP